MPTGNKLITIVVAIIIVIIIIALSTVFTIRCSLDVLVSSKDQVMTHNLKSLELFSIF